MRKVSCTIPHFCQPQPTQASAIFKVASPSPARRPLLPFSERSASADREIERAEGEEKTIMREVYQHSTFYTLSEGVSLVVSTKTVLYPDGRMFEVEEKKITLNKEN